MVDSYRYPGRIGISVKIVSDATVFHKETMKPAACGRPPEVDAARGEREAGGAGRLNALKPGAEPERVSTGFWQRAETMILAGRGIDGSFRWSRFDKEQELDTVSAEDVSTLLVGCDKISLQLCEFIAKYMDSVDYPKEETLNEIR